MTASYQPKRAYIATFGCQMNVYDSERMRGLLAGLGYESADRPEGADLILVNTCSVREKAQQKVRSYLGALKKLKDARPEMIIAVAGCVAQQEGKRLLSKVPHLDLVLGTQEVSRLPELVAEAAQGRRLAAVSLKPRPIEPLAPADPGLSAMVTVMTGCDNFCAYCVVPYVRGRERSRPAGDVIRELELLAQRGAREVMLLGQNVNSYRDPDGGLDFAGLLGRAARVPDILRLRFTTNHPKDLSPALMEIMADEPKVMEQIHLPAQSGSDRVLEAMNRGYTRDQYLDRVRELRRQVPEVCLGGDVIVGFPGETEEDFEQSLSLLEEVGYDWLFSFKYSDRPFAKAAGFPAKLKEETKRRRLARLQELQKRIGLAKNQELVGRRLEVLVEGPDKKGSGLVAGKSRGGKAVNFPGGPELTGELLPVEITEALENSLMGRLAVGGEDEA